MASLNRAIPRTVLTDFCKTLGYNPNEVIEIQASSKAIAVRTMPDGVTGLEGVTTVHLIDDVEVKA